MQKERSKRLRWREIPAENIIRILGTNGMNIMPKGGYDADVLVREDGIPRYLLPIHVVPDNDPSILPEQLEDGTLSRKGGPTVNGGELIQHIARGLDVRAPDFAPSFNENPSEYCILLAMAVVCHLRGSVRIEGVEHPMPVLPAEQGQEH